MINSLKHLYILYAMINLKYLNNKYKLLMMCRDNNYYNTYLNNLKILCGYNVL